MLGIILNENKIVDDLLNGIKYNKPMIAINTLIKYMYINGERDKISIREDVIKIMNNCDCAFKRKLWVETIDNAITRFFKNTRKYHNEVKLVDVDHINITIQELNKISELNDKKLQKVAFILLVYAKLTNEILEREDGWINLNAGNVFKEARVSGNNKSRMLFLNELYSKGMISLSNKSSKTSLKINYIIDDGDIGFELRDFDGCIHYYLNYIGEKWKRCSECGAWIKQKSKKPRLYCNDCARIKNIKKTVENRKSLI